MPTPDDPSDMDAPMTRALFATDVEDGPLGPTPDPEGTLDEVTKRLTDKANLSDGTPAHSGGAGPAPGSMSAWIGGSGGGVGGSGGGTGGSGGGTGSGGRGIFGKIEPGQTLYSKYRVLKKLGSGAMGEVWLVRHATLKSEHALKLIVPNIASNSVALMRFQREFEVMAWLRHEHAVTIYDACLDEDGGFIDMEYVDGQTIHEILASARSRSDLDPSAPLMPLDWIVRVLDQLCDVLQVAHEKGIVHRDLKPSNMMLLNGRKPGKEYLKVLDFGIAKVRDDPDNAANGAEANQNKTQGFIGTPSYGSPEQAMAVVDVDGRSDLYSLGIMLYEFITGRLPFRGNHWQVMSQNATAPPPPFGVTNPSLRPIPEVEHAVLRVLSKDRDHRPQTARELFEEFRDAVEAVLPPGSPGMTPPTWEAVSFAPPPPSTGPTLQPTEVNHAHATASGRISHVPETLHGDAPSVEFAKPSAQRWSDFGGAVADPKAPSRSRIGLLVGLLLCFAVAVGLFIASSPRKPPRVVPVTPPDVTGPAKSRPPTFVECWPETYVPVKGYGEDKLYPDKVRRTTDEVIFERFADRVYLPDGYKPENPTDLVEGWPRAITREGIRFLRIKGDIDWVMGSWDAPGDLTRPDAPAHPVFLTGYYMQETEVTNGQIEDFLKQKYTIQPREWQVYFDNLQRVPGPDVARSHPAVYLSRKEALAFADHMDGLLPTEAQWEFAARCRGKDIHYVWGNKPRPSRDMANINQMNASTTAPVKSFPKDRTEEGLFDMIGNVQEMCRDAWESYRKSTLPMIDPCASPSNPDTPEFTIRGGSYNSLPEECATNRRDDHRPENDRVENLGFRLVIECPAPRKPR